MNVDEAIDKACADVGILPPKTVAPGRWLKTDTLSGRNGKGDGRVIVHEHCVTGMNWQTGEKSTVWLEDAKSTVVRTKMRASMQKQAADRKKLAARAAETAAKLIAAATLQEHEYLAAKGFPAEKALVVDAAVVERIGGRYLLPDDGGRAIVIPCRAGGVIKSVQLIWGRGEKSFLYGGETSGTSHRIATGRDCWHCEGYATGLSLRAAFQAIRYAPTILCCFSASNVEKVAANAQGRPFIAADNDKPLEQFGGVGAGEFFARRASVPFLMPPAIGDDINDMHQRDGIFAVQRLIVDFLRDSRAIGTIRPAPMRFSAARRATSE